MNELEKLLSSQSWDEEEQYMDGASLGYYEYVYVGDVDFQQARIELTEMQKEIGEKTDQLQWWLETYDITMPCGHKNCYLAGEKDTQYCVLCLVESQQQTIDDLQEYQ